MNFPDEQKRKEAAASRLSRITDFLQRERLDNAAMHINGFLIFVFVVNAIFTAVFVAGISFNFWYPDGLTADITTNDRIQFAVIATVLMTVTVGLFDGSRWAWDQASIANNTTLAQQRLATGLEWFYMFLTSGASVMGLRWVYSLIMGISLSDIEKDYVLFLQLLTVALTVDIAGVFIYKYLSPTSKRNRMLAHQSARSMGVLMNNFQVVMRDAENETAEWLEDFMPRIIKKHRETQLVDLLGGLGYFHPDDPVMQMLKGSQTPQIATGAPQNQPLLETPQPVNTITYEAQDEEIDLHFQVWHDGRFYPNRYHNAITARFTIDELSKRGQTYLWNHLNNRVEYVPHLSHLPFDKLSMPYTAFVDNIFRFQHSERDYAGRACTRIAGSGQEAWLILRDDHEWPIRLYRGDRVYRGRFSPTDGSIQLDNQAESPPAEANQPTELSKNGSAPAPSVESQ